MENSLRFFVAGYETTATVLSYACYMMSLNPEVQEKLYQELKNAFNHNEMIKYEEVMKLPYLDAVVNETLRYFPPLLRIEREAKRDYTLGNTGIVVDKGVIISVPTVPLHHNPKYFPEPEKFKPERFSEPVDPYAFIPFGIGPRNCIAMRFALLEVKLTLAHIMTKFKFFPVKETKFPPEYQMGQQLNRAKKLVVGVQEIQQTSL